MSMIHCIDCIHRKVCKYNSFTHPSQIIDGTCFDYKTCDVVPRSEYEELAFQFRELDIECDRLEKVEEQYNKLKSEVEHWKQEANHYQTLWCRTYNDFEISELITEAKQELAREIFAEIRKEIKLALDSNYKARQERIEKHYNGMYGVYANFISLIDGKINALRGIDDFLDELEKKYIGDTTDGGVSSEYNFETGF